MRSYITIIFLTFLMLLVLFVEDISQINSSVTKEIIVEEMNLDGHTIMVEEKINSLEKEKEMIAKVVYREARGSSKQHQAAVVWVILNRVDAKGYGNTIEEVITRPNQFAWIPNTPVLDEHLELAEDVLRRWLLEKTGVKEVGRVLPSDYLFFAASNGQNYFRQNFDSDTCWNWNLKNPY